MLRAFHTEMSSLTLGDVFPQGAIPGTYIVFGDKLVAEYTFTGDVSESDPWWVGFNGTAATLYLSLKADRVPVRGTREIPRLVREGLEAAETGRFRHHEDSEHWREDLLVEGLLDSVAVLRDRDGDVYTAQVRALPYLGNVSAREDEILAVLAESPYK